MRSELSNQIFEDGCLETNMDCTDLVKRFPMGIDYLITKIGVDTANHQPFKL